MEFSQKLLYLQVSQTARLSPSESSTLSQAFLRISKQSFVFVSSPKKQTHIVCKNRPNIVDRIYRTEDELQSCIGLAP